MSLPQPIPAVIGQVRRLHVPAPPAASDWIQPLFIGGAVAFVPALITRFLWAADEPPFAAGLLLPMAVIAAPLVWFMRPRRLATVAGSDGLATIDVSPLTVRREWRTMAFVEATELMLHWRRVLDHRHRYHGTRVELVVRRGDRKIFQHLALIRERNAMGSDVDLSGIESLPEDHAIHFIQAARTAWKERSATSVPRSAVDDG